ncbi:unnamed protein product [Tenebrio molitor]|nr:unnamed protein product [Tenebrio molitor]
MKYLAVFGLLLATVLIVTESSSDVEDRPVLRRLARAAVKDSCVNRPCTINGHCSDCCIFPMWDFVALENVVVFKISTR